MVATRGRDKRKANIIKWDGKVKSKNEKNCPVRRQQCQRYPYQYPTAVLGYWATGYISIPDTKDELPKHACNHATASFCRSNKPRVLPSTASEPAESTYESLLKSQHPSADHPIAFGFGVGFGSGRPWPLGTTTKTPVNIHLSYEPRLKVSVR